MPHPSTSRVSSPRRAAGSSTRRNGTAAGPLTPWGDPGPERPEPPTDEHLRPLPASLLRWAPYVLYLVICVAALPATSDGFPTADGVSYFSIAENWAAGRFDLAVNGFWSPLLSFLLVPAALVDAPMFLSGQLVMIATGLVTVSRMKRLMRALNYDTVADDVLVIGSVPLIAYAALSLLTPDLLMGTLLLGYLSTMIDQRPITPRRRGVLAGCWAGAAFLAKAYALPFVIAHLFLTVVVRLVRRSDLGQRWVFSAVTGAIVALIVLPWATLLSIEYDRPTVTTVGDYHVDVTADGAAGNAFVWAGILPPPNEFAVSAWEDPSLLPRHEADTGASVGDAGGGDGVDDTTASDRLVNRVRRTIGSLRVALVAGGLMGLTGLVGTLSMVWWLVSRRPTRPVRHAAPDPFVDIVLAVAVYIGGLSLLVIETRYLWAPLLLTVPCAAWGLRRVRRRQRFVAMRAMAVVVAAGSIAGPAIGIGRVVDKAADQERLLAQLAPVLEPGDRVVTSRSALSSLPGLCFSNGCQYWGATAADSVEELDRRLDLDSIDVYIAFGDDGASGGAFVRDIERPGSDLTVYDQRQGTP